MMVKVKIYGAGSIGNHLAHACRGKQWEVLVCDVDPAALERTRNDIYPARYGAWDEAIRLSAMDAAAGEEADFVIIGTPPDTHLELALGCLRSRSPRVLLIEKPLCPPDLADCGELLAAAQEAGTTVLVGYNHVLTRNTLAAEDILGSGAYGSPLSMNVRWQEHWGGIFEAHPWLAGPRDSYLGFADRGGGACGEHSHAINIWQHFARVLGLGRIAEVSCMMDMVAADGVCYDRVAQLSVRSEKGLIGTIVQDVITKPAVKTLRLQCADGCLEWYANYADGQDAVLAKDGNAPREERLYAKTRPDDFKGEIDHVDALLQGKTEQSPLSLERGLDTMLVIAAAHRSRAIGRAVRINYAKGYGPGSLEPIECSR
jgi:predicted dehydrogenase